MPTVSPLPPLSQFLSTELQRRVVDVLHDASFDTQGRAESLRRPTLGLVYGDLVSRRMRSMAAEVGKEVLAVDGGRLPVVYKVGGLCLIHYSVHIQGESYVTNGGKSLLEEYLEHIDQRPLFEPESDPLSRIDGPLAVLATELRVSVTSSGLRLTLNHAFVGYPADLSKQGAVTSWHDGRIVLTASPVSDVTPEKHERIEQIPVRQSDGIDTEGGEQATKNTNK
jgi:hypothetical protein